MDSNGIPGKDRKTLKVEDTRIKKRGTPRINKRRPRRNGRKGKWRIKVSENSITGTAVTKERCGKLKKLRRLTTSSSLVSLTLRCPSWSSGTIFAFKSQHCAFVLPGASLFPNHRRKTNRLVGRQTAMLDLLTTYLSFCCSSHPVPRYFPILEKVEYSMKSCWRINLPADKIKLIQMFFSPSSLLFFRPRKGWIKH